MNSGLNGNIEEPYSDEVFKTILNNPYLIQISDEVNEKTLAKWISKEYIKNFGERIKNRDILGLITKLVFDGFFIQSKIGPRTLLRPTKNYFLIKRGEKIDEIIQNNQITVTENFAKSERESEFVNLIIEEKINEDTIGIEKFSFHDILLNQMTKNGANQGITKYSPHFFKLLCNILNDQFIDWHTRILISSALGYFVMDEDVIPDNIENGYVDDLFIICYVLREIKNNISSELIEENWPYEEDIFELVDDIYEKSYRIVQDKACEILQTVGIHRFKTLELEEYSGTYQDKIAKLGSEKRELIAISAFLIKMLYNVDMGRNFKEIKTYVKKYGSYDEINRLIELSKLNHDIQQKKDDKSYTFEDELEEELKQARLKALLDD